MNAMLTQIDWHSAVDMVEMAAVGKRFVQIGAQEDRVARVVDGIRVWSGLVCILRHAILSRTTPLHFAGPDEPLLCLRYDV